MENTVSDLVLSINRLNEKIDRYADERMQHSYLLFSKALLLAYEQGVAIKIEEDEKSTAIHRVIFYVKDEHDCDIKISIRYWKNDLKDDNYSDMLINDGNIGIVIDYQLFMDKLLHDCCCFDDFQAWVKLSGLDKFALGVQ